MAIQQAYEQYVNLLYEMLISNCPVDTGNMVTHIRMENDGQQCVITIDTVPYNKAPKALKKRIKKYGMKNAQNEVEYAEYTEYPRSNGKNPNEGWIRQDSILSAAMALTSEVEYYL